MRGFIKKLGLMGNIAVLVVICRCCLPVQAKYGGGTGEPNDPYLIYDANQMNAIGADSNDWDTNFKLMADIDLRGFTGASFNIIGELYYDGGWVLNPFTGVFNGNGHTISNFSYTSTGINCIGLFVYLEGAEIKDLVLIDPNVDAGTGWDVGSLVGYLKDGTITNCRVKGGSVGGCWGIGGLVGRNCGTITQCYVTGNVTGTCSYSGGLVGINDGGTITKCYSTGSVTGKGLVGGLVGANNEGTIYQCYSRGGVTGYKEIGGLVGSDSYGGISNCYSTGRVSGNASVGGLVGYSETGDVDNSFWDIETSDCDISAGGIGKITAEMQTLNTFVDAGWDFENVWWIFEGQDYPRFLWETFGGGSGQPNDPYLIYTAEQLNTIGLIPFLWNRHFKLMADVDLSSFTGTSFNIIGTDYYHPFTGVFDGNGHKISNFNYTCPGRSRVGIFGYVFDAKAEIKDLGLTAPNIDVVRGSNVGSLVGWFRGGTITDCYVEDSSVVGSEYVGGLVGESEGIITNCFSTGSVIGERGVGGLVGYNMKGTIANCYSSVSVSGVDLDGGLVGYMYVGTIVGGLVGYKYGGEIIGCCSSGNVLGEDHHVGGLVGWNASWGAITNCYATGSVIGGRCVGGLVGENGKWPGTGSTIDNCYSTGSVTGLRWWVLEVGGLVGVGGGTINCFWDIDTSGQTTSAGGTGKTTTEMKTASTYIFWNRCDDIFWTIDEGNDYPRLIWENMPGEVINNPCWQGSGTETDPYLIYTAEQLNTIGLIPCGWDKHFKLMADIDLSGYTGTSFNIIVRFTGTFNGNGHTINHFTYDCNGVNYIGLFGHIDNPSAEIKNLGLIEPNVDAGTGGLVGSLAGQLEDGTISNCYIEGGSVSGEEEVGGMVGRNYYATVTKCYSSVSVCGINRVGGLVGNNILSTISNCYSTADVNGTTNVGGLVGWNRYGVISSCYSTGSVSGNTGVGGLAGYNEIGDVINSFWDIETSGQTTSAGGTGLSTAEMQEVNTFVDAGWDFENVWWFFEGKDYPRLLWENFGGGSGQPNDPYLIYTAEQLNTIGLIPFLWDKHFRLMADINLSSFTGTSFNIIGYWLNWADNKPFSGVFDGNGYRILNFSYTSIDRNYIGLFGYVSGENVQIKNLGLIDPTIDATSGDYVGSLIGIFGVGSVSNCKVEGGSISGVGVVGGLVGLNYAKITENYSMGSVFGNDNVGGLVGQNYGTITNSDSAAEVSGNASVGGLVGVNKYGTITNCQSNGDVSGMYGVGGLVGDNSYGAIANCDSSGDVSGQSGVGGLVGWGGTITNCFAVGGVEGVMYVGGLVGTGDVNITNCYASGNVSGGNYVGGLAGAGRNFTNCYATGTVLGEDFVGGLVGQSNRTLTKCYSTGSVSGDDYVGGLVGDNHDLISNCYSSGTVSGDNCVGGLTGHNTGGAYLFGGIISNCYSTSSVEGNDEVGGLVGYHNKGSYTKCFWNNIVNSGLSGIGNTTDPNVIGESTINMQIEKTFTDAGWDFSTPVWTIDEGVVYPRLWWEFVPVLHAKPEVTLGTSNTVSWGPVFIAVEYYVECSEDANFAGIIHNSGWIKETSFEFTGLELGQRYWYSVKAKNTVGTESSWSNVETSLQGTLADAVDIMLAPENLKNENMKNTLLNKIDEVLVMIDEGLYSDALDKLEYDILAKMNGCGEMGGPDNNDWIITCEAQSEIYPLVIETIEYVNDLMKQSVQ